MWNSRNWIKQFFIIIAFLHSFILLLGQDAPTAPLIELQLVPAGDSSYKLLISNIYCFDIKISTIHANELQDNTWTSTKKVIKKGPAYDLLEIRTNQLWRLDRGIHYENLISPCNKDKVSFLRFSNGTLELIMPSVVEESYAYKIVNGDSQDTVYIVLKGETRIPLWCYGKSSSAYYIFKSEGPPRSRVLVEKETLGDINPRPVWEIFF